MSGFVYKWTDTSNNMYYIGSHKGTPDDGYIGSGKFFKRAYNKRKSFFTREILYTGEHYRELEEFILEELDAASEIKSYNLKNGAIGGATRTGMKNSQEHISKVAEGNRGKKLSKETREKIRQSRIGTKHSDESKAKMSKSRTGNKNHFYGKKHSQETKDKISLANKGHYIGDELMQQIWDKNKKSVYCEYLNKVFDSINQCAKELGISSSTISNMMAGRAKNKFGIKRIF